MQSPYPTLFVSYMLGLHAFGGYTVLKPFVLPWEIIKSFRSQTAFNTAIHLAKPFELPEIRAN